MIQPIEGYKGSLLLVIHSDRLSQYKSYGYQKNIEKIITH